LNLTAQANAFSLKKEKIMAENLPNLPTGAVPPKPLEPAKVQPKKETVRINLPPKPTTTPTIKLPTPPAAASPTPVAAPAAAPAPSAGVTGAPPAAAPAAVPVPVKAAPAAPRSAPAPMAPVSAGVNPVDTVLALIVLVVGLIVVVRVYLL
jgi:hypothetical protein